jgi:hypothetical protein
MLEKPRYLPVESENISWKVIHTVQEWIYVHGLRSSTRVEGHPKFWGWNTKSYLVCTSGLPVPWMGDDWRAQLRQRCQFYYWVNFILMFSLLECSLPVTLQFSQNLLVHNVPGAFVWSENAFLFQLWTVQRTASHVWKLKICPSALFMVMAKACDQLWAVVRSTASCQQCGWLRLVIPRHLPLSWLCDVRRCPRSDVISELRQRVAVDTLMTSHYSGDVTWIRKEVCVFGRIDAIRLKHLFDDF